MKSKVADKIRIVRLTKGLSQQNMADELGITVAAYSNIERGVADITVTRLFQICKIFGYSVNLILDDNENNPTLMPLPEKKIEQLVDSQKLDQIIRQLTIQQEEMTNLKHELLKLKKVKKSTK